MSGNAAKKEKKKEKRNTEHHLQRQNTSKEVSPSLLYNGSWVSLIQRHSICPVLQQNSYSSLPWVAAEMIHFNDKYFIPKLEIKEYPNTPEEGNTLIILNSQSHPLLPSPTFVACSFAFFGASDTSLLDHPLWHSSITYIPQINLCLNHSHLQLPYHLSPFTAKTLQRQD